MSCFGGKMMEYSCVSLDRFDGINLMSKVFILSHVHQDHMVGLDSDQFYRHLANNNYTVWCHPISKVFLLADSRYRRLQKFISTLEVDNTTLIKIDESGGNISITFLSAGHCPGSVMCLIEGSEGTVLYTGDIRLSVSDLKSMKHLNLNNQTAIRIESLYFDSTFCVPEAVTIPDRHQSLQATVQLVRNWVTKSEKHKVLLYCAARYGHEFLMVGLFKKLGMKVHVTPEKMKIYEQIPEIKQCVTLDYSTPIHCCAFWEESDEGRVGKSKRWKEIPSCEYCHATDANVLLVKPSVMYFTQSPSVDQVAFYDRRNDLYRILYSCHSSMTELREMIAYLKPARAFPNVQPMKSTLKQVERRIQDLLQPQNGTRIIQKSPYNNHEYTTPYEEKERSVVSLKCRDEYLANLESSSDEDSPSPDSIKDGNVLDIQMDYSQSLSQQSRCNSRSPLEIKRDFTTFPSNLVQLCEENEYSLNPKKCIELITLEDSL